MRRRFFLRTTLLASLLALCSTTAFAQNAYRSKGYKGNVELGANTCGVALYTTHGYQFNRFFFVGGGIGYIGEALPIYADFKTYFTKKQLKVEPWLEYRLGFEPLWCCGFTAIGAGIAVPIAKDYAITVALDGGGFLEEGGGYVGLKAGFQF